MLMFSSNALGDSPESLALLADLRAAQLPADMAQRWDAALAAGVDATRVCGSIRLPAGGGKQTPRAAPLLALLRRPESRRSTGSWLEQAENAREMGDAIREKESHEGLEARSRWEAMAQHALANAGLADCWRAKASWGDLIFLSAQALSALFAQARATASLWADPAGESPWNALASLEPSIRRSMKTAEESALLHATLLAAKAPSTLGQNPLFALIRESTNSRGENLGIDFALSRAIFDSDLSFHHGAERSALRVIEDLKETGLRERPQLVRGMEEVMRLIEADVLLHETQKAKALTTACDPQGASESKPRRIKRI